MLEKSFAFDLLPANAVGPTGIVFAASCRFAEKKNADGSEFH